MFAAINMYEDFSLIPSSQPQITFSQATGL